MEQILPGLVIGVVVAVAGAFVSHLLIRSRERERWAREDELRREQHGREDEFRDHGERRQLYTDFMAASYRVHAGDRSEEAIAGLRSSWMAVRLVAPEDVEEAARRMFYGLVPEDARKRYPPLLANALIAFERSTYAATRGVYSTEFSYLNNLTQFVRAARKDLGKDIHSDE